ncbi:hypothetical protein [Streptomyces seoulensis]|uniref:hypothetical protein n=1 Tax=Streptomyces seoulensis TaxID=73044 RepID=UPI001FCB5EB1|nr:hypothetical protein [Streptomyces seoulensis]BDH04856.1 hypothetical protein HEK131_20830 [Streptomyces seoulensis]
MSAQPTERPLSNWDREAIGELAVSALVDYLPLPVGAMTPRADAVHITVVSSRELALWVWELGGRIDKGPSSGGVTLWTLYTETPERGTKGAPVLIRVHVAVVDGEDVLAEVRPGAGR